MGWTQFHQDKGQTKQWFKKTWEEGGNYKVLDSALVNRVTMFGAIQKVSTGEVFAAVFMISWSKGYMNFSYKDMTEHSGPYQHNCPQRIMKLLTPLDEKDGEDNFAIQWRKSVEEYWKKKDGISKIGMNSVIKTAEPLSFTNGKTYQYFRKVGRKFLGGVMNDNVFLPYSFVRFNLSNYKYEVL